MLCSYAVINTNEKERIESSSGGVMSLLARQIIDDDGVVYGVKNNVYSMKYISVDSKSDISLIRGSKYVKVSNFSTIINDIESNIKNNKLFMFVGTPCQVKSVRNIVEKYGYRKCLLVDLICHGVMNEKSFGRLIEWIENKYQDKIKSISFRKKERGWKEQKWEILLQSGQLAKDKDVDMIKKTYLAHFAHEEACLNCMFTNLDRPGDLTIGDLWGVEKYSSIEDDDKGINIVLVNNKKGKEHFDLMQENTWSKEVDLNDFLQPQLRENIKTNIKEREYFLKNIDKFEFISKLMFSRSLFYRILRNIIIKL